MRFFRWLGLGLSASLFSLAIFLFAMCFSAYRVFDTPKQLEAALQQSGVYGGVVQQLLVIGQSQNNSGSDSIPLDDPSVQAAIKAAVPAATVQNSAEQIINGTYAWLHGTTSSPAFSIDLTPIKAGIADNLGAYLQQKLSAAPVCAPGTVPPQNASEIFSLDCLPRGVSAAMLVSQVQNAVKGSAIIPESSITAGNLKDKQGQPLVVKLSAAPRYHHYFIQSLYALPAIIVLSGLGVVLLSKTRRAGVRRLCMTLLTTGIYSTVIAFVALWGISHLANVASGQTNDLAELQGELLRVVASLVRDLRSWWLGFGIGYMAIGSIGLIIVHASHPKRPQSEQTTPIQAKLAGNAQKPDESFAAPAVGTTFRPQPQDEPAPADQSASQSKTADKADRH